MATGLIGESPRNQCIRLVDAATTTNGAPSGASAGVSLAAIATTFDLLQKAIVIVRSTAGSGTMTVTVRLWGYSIVAANWSPLDAGADATKGVINAGSVMGETGADEIDHSEPIEGIGPFDRLYAEITAIAGTATAVTVELLIPRVP